MSTENIKTETDSSPKPPTVDVGSLARGSASVEQVRLQYKAVVKLCENLALVHRETGEIIDRFPPGIVEMAGKRSAEIMELLGDVLNAMDAVDDEEDAWMEPIFAEAQRLWPNVGHEPRRT